MIKIKKQDYLGLDHEAVRAGFEGDLTFINYMNITDTHGSNFVGAVYRSSNPNRKKGHKDFMILRSHTDPVLMTTKLYVLGRDVEEMKNLRIHKAVLCGECNTILVSLYRHDFNGCGCPNQTFVDGGRDYLRCGGKDILKIKSIKVDLLTDETVE